MTGLELAFAICAAIGGFLFLLRFVLQLFGLHHDVGLDIQSADLDLSHSDVGFKALSFQGITAFLMMFGLAGMAIYHDGKLHAGLAIAGATLAGVGSAWIIALMFRGMRRLQSAGDYNPRQAIGQQGTVYLGIPAGGVGKVTVVVNNRLSVLDAVAQDHLEIKTGETIHVVGLLNDTTLMVAR